MCKSWEAKGGIGCGIEFYLSNQHPFIEIHKENVNGRRISQGILFTEIGSDLKNKYVMQKIDEKLRVA